MDAFCALLVHEGGKTLADAVAEVAAQQGRRCVLDDSDFAGTLTVADLVAAVDAMTRAFDEATGNAVLQTICAMRLTLGLHMLGRLSEAIAFGRVAGGGVFVPAVADVFLNAAQIQRLRDSLGSARREDTDLLLPRVDLGELLPAPAGRAAPPSRGIPVTLWVAWEVALFLAATALLLAMVGFVGTVSYAKFLLRGDIIE